MSENAASLLDQLATLHKDRTIHLTKDRIDNYYSSVRSSLAYSSKSSGSSSSDRSGGYIPILGTGFVHESDFPTDLEGLERLKKLMDQKQFTNFRLYKDLVEEYAKLGNLVWKTPLTILIVFVKFQLKILLKFLWWLVLLLNRIKLNHFLVRFNREETSRKNSPYLRTPLTPSSSVTAERRSLTRAWTCSLSRGPQILLPNLVSYESKTELLSVKSDRSIFSQTLQHS